MAPDSTWMTGVVDTTGVAPGAEADLRTKAPAVEWPKAPSNGGHPAITPDGVEHQPIDVTKTGTISIAGDRGDTTGTSTIAPPTGPVLSEENPPAIEDEDDEENEDDGTPDGSSEETPETPEASEGEGDPGETPEPEPEPGDATSDPEAPADGSEGTEDGEGDEAPADGESETSES